MRPRMGQMGVQNVRLLSEFLLPWSCAPSSGRMSARPEAATEVLRGGQRGAGKGVRPRVRGCVLLIGLVSPPGLGAPGAGSRELEDAALPISRPREAGDMGNAASSRYPRTSAVCHFKGFRTPPESRPGLQTPGTGDPDSTCPWSRWAGARGQSSRQCRWCFCRRAFFRELRATLAASRKTSSTFSRNLAEHSR